MEKEYGYEYEAARNDALWEQTRGKVTYETLHGAICLRSGRDALKAVAREFEPTTVLLPALCCDFMILPFEQYGHSVRFYRNKTDYSADVDSIFGLLPRDRKPFLLLYMSYFGITALTDSNFEQIRTRCPEAVLIEDRTHNLLEQPTGNAEPDYTVASLRKWIAVPDGGLLWSKRPLRNTAFSDDTAFSTERLRAQNLRYRFLRTGEPELKTEFRRVFSTVTDRIDRETQPARMSAYSYELAVGTDWQSVAAKRKENADVLLRELAGCDIKPIRKASPAADVYTAILVDNRDGCQRRLAQRGIFCTVIWPLRPEQKNACAVATYTSEHMLAIYCDQRYSTQDMISIAINIKRLIHE